MSSKGALILVLSAIVALGAFAAWLVNVPLWAVAGLVAVAVVAIRFIYRRIERRSHRQNTEA